MFIQRKIEGSCGTDQMAGIFATSAAASRGRPSASFLGKLSDGVAEPGIALGNFSGLTHASHENSHAYASSIEAFHIAAESARGWYVCQACVVHDHAMAAETPC